MRIRIPGKFWGSHTSHLQKELLLVGVDGTLHSLPWAKLIPSLKVPEHLRHLLIFTVGPGGGLKSMSRFWEGTFEGMLKANLTLLAGHLKDQTVDPSLFTKSDNIFPCWPYTDASFGGVYAYACGSSGLYQSRDMGPAHKLTDAPGIALTDSHGFRIAMAGPEGLLRTDPKSEMDPAHPWKRDLYLASTTPCNTVVGAPRTNTLAASQNGKSLYLSSVNAVLSEEPFGEPSFDDGIQWAAGEYYESALTLYRYHQGSIRTLWQTTDMSFYDLGERKVPELEMAKFVSVQASDFGSVFEFDDYTLVLLNSGETLRFEGEAIVKAHPGQLHLIRDDHIEIVFFPNLGRQLFGFGSMPWATPDIKAILGI